MVLDVQDEDEGSPVSSKEKETTLRSQKVNWLITYGASGQSITADMLKERDVGLVVDECYTSKDRAHNYTLIHLEKRSYQKRVERGVKLVCERYGLVLNNVYGMECIESGTKEEEGSIRKHPLLQWMVKDFQKRNPTFELWVAPKQISKALFRDAMEGRDTERFEKLTRWSKKMLANTLLLERENSERMQKEMNELRSENRRLLDKEKGPAMSDN